MEDVDIWAEEIKDQTCPVDALTCDVRGIEGAWQVRGNGGDFPDHHRAQTSTGD